MVEVNGILVEEKAKDKEVDLHFRVKFVRKLVILQLYAIILIQILKIQFLKVIIVFKFLMHYKTHLQMFNNQPSFKSHFTQTHNHA